MIKQHDCVVLTQNLPQEGLQAGDVGTVVHIHQGGAGYEVEFMTLAGETVAITTLLAGQVRPIARRDIAHGGNSARRKLAERERIERSATRSTSRQRF